MKYIITEAQLSEIVCNTINKVLLPESKQDDLAKEYLRNHGYEDNDTRLKIRGELLRQVPNLKLDKRKFMLAAVRYFCNGQLSDNSSLSSFNKALKLIHDGGHTNEFDYDLNGMSLDDLTVKFRDIAKQSGAEDRMRSANRQFTGGSEYTIIPITSFEEAEQYGRYTSWCVTHGEDAYDSYTKGGEKFYFCLRNGFENVPENAGQNAPLDDYGLSMISVLVDCEGDLDRVTTRWNHEFGGENHSGLSTTKQLEDLLNVNFYNTFVPYTKDELLKKGVIPLYAVSEMLAQGVPPEKIFSKIDTKFFEGFARVKLNGKWNYINANGELLSPSQWLDWCHNFKEGLAKVILNGKCNYINTNGELLSPNKWFDNCRSFKEGFARVELDGKCNYINTNGELLSPNIWFNWGWDFNEGFAAVKLGERWYEIDTKGQLYTENGDPVNSSLQENRRYKKNKKHIIRITESQLRNAISKAIKKN